MLPPGGEAAKEPRLVNCAENRLGLQDFLKGKADLVVTADKDGPNCGAGCQGLPTIPSDSDAELLDLPVTIKQLCNRTDVPHRK